MPTASGSRVSCSLLVFALMLGKAATAQAGTGGMGDACQTKVDCRHGLKCANETCIADPDADQGCNADTDCSGGKCVDGSCSSASPTVSSTKEVKDDDEQVVSSAQLRHTRPFVGVTVGGGAAYSIVSDGAGGGPSTTSLGGAFLFAIRGGVMLDNREIAIELAPMTYAFTTPSQGPVMEASITYGFMIPLVDGKSVSVFWPLRGGAGFVGVNAPGDRFFLQAKLDVIGVAFNIALPHGSLLLELHLPSARFLISPGGSTNPNIMIPTWLPGAGASYVF